MPQGKNGCGWVFGDYCNGDRFPEYMDFIFISPAAEIGRQLMGTKQARLFHEHVLVKEASAGVATPWHQDQFYWPVNTANTITMWMPLVDIHEEMGILTFASGSHKKGNVFEFEIGDESDPDYDKYIKENKFPLVTRTTMHTGDAT